MMYSPDKMMGSKGLHGAPITAPGCFPSGRYSPPPYRAAPDPMPPPPRRCMPNPTVSEIIGSLQFHVRIAPPRYIPLDTASSGCKNTLRHSFAQSITDHARARHSPDVNPRVAMMSDYSRCSMIGYDFSPPA
ncbi:unnamed protein product [Lasius platythorax]|uniref:Uncharacterized protein n=1 Tax=Lasius platythorax TaxID=488582 RepID=A0AAV2NGV9_9HYME